MKTKYIAILASLAAAGLCMAQTAYTTPVGYTTQPLVAGFNLIGLNLSNPVSTAGRFETISGTSLTDTEVGFGTALAAGQPHIVRITSGVNTGISTSITSFSGNTIVTSDNISALIATTDNYEIRKSVTIADAFGATNIAGLKPGVGNSTGADLVWAQTTTGFVQVYYNGTAGSGFGAIGVGWKTTTTGNTNAANTPLYFTDAIFVQRRGVGPLSLTFSGSVITNSSVVAIEPGFNYVSRILPVGFTLGSSNLQNFLTQGNTNSLAADIIWVSNGSGGYNQYYYNGTAGSGFGALTVGWRSTTTGNTSQTAVNLSDGFIIQRKTTARNIVIPIPSGINF